MFRMAVSSFLMILIIYTAVLAQNKTEYQPVKKFDPGRDAAKDISNAIQYAKEVHKNILLDVGGDWCIWCHRIDEFINSHEEIRKFIEDNYVEVKINYSKENKNEKLLSNYPAIKGYPHLFVLDSDGKLLHSQDTGLLEQDKSYSLIKFMEFLKKWAPGKEG